MIARCGRFGAPFPKPQVLGKTTLHALSFDLSNCQFGALISCFQAPSKHGHCVRGYGMLTVTYTCSVHGFPKRQSCTLPEGKKEYIGSKIQIFI